jgi:chemotaxis protein histidine kinase CheA
MSDEEIVKEFLVESYENLDRLDEELIALEKDPDDRDTLGSVFRTLHTIKGTSGFLAFNQLEAVAHSGENLLARLRDGALPLRPEITAALLAMVDAIRQMLSRIESTGNEGERNDQELIATLTQLLEAPETGAKVPEQQPPPETPQAKWQATTPQGTPTIGEILIRRGVAKVSDVYEAVQQQKAGDPRRVGEILVEKGSVKSQDVLDALNAQQQAHPQSASDSTIRVDVDLLDRLMNLVGELVLARNQLLQFNATREDSSFNTSAQRVDLITTELQEGVMKTRMQPIGNIWNKFPRVVRDVATGCGKQVRIEMEGKDTELDKTIIEAIKDPLTHLVRNAVDHGIETPAKRKAAGKDPEGRLLLRAFHEGGQVNIEITDDGAGLDHEKIRKKAIERNLVSSEQAAQLSEREIANLIFLPGFSTAEKVTNVSGRGVGMDVVKTNIEKIGGTVDLHSKPGQGSTVRMKIPLTLAIIPALIVTSAGDRYAIPQASLLELVRLKSEQVRKGIEEVKGVPVYRLRGQLLPLVYLNRELQTGAKAQHSGDSRASGASSEALDFALAREKHLLWTGRLRQVLDGKLTLTQEQAGSPKDCALGKWLYSTGLNEYGDIADMHVLEAAHRQFHEAVREVIALKEKGNQNAAELALERIAPMSNHVVDLLTTLARKVLESQNANIVVLQADDRQFGLVVEEINDAEEIVVKPLAKQLSGLSCYAGACIMGDGGIALILDVIGLAQQAHVIDEARSHALTEKRGDAAGTNASQQTFLVFAGPDNSRMAVPLAAVARLEELPATQAENAGPQWVTQYRGQILPLVNLGAALQERRRQKRQQHEAPVRDGSLPVVVCHHEGHLVGLVVERILDIVEDAAELRYPATRSGVLESAVIQGKVTELLDIPVVLRRAGVLSPAARAASAKAGP